MNVSPLAAAKDSHNTRPSCIPQVRDTLGALAERFTALKLNNGGLHLSRLMRMHSKAMALKRIVMYSPAWVKSQNRMASTSNQVPCSTHTIPIPSRYGYTFSFCLQVSTASWNP